MPRCSSSRLVMKLGRLGGRLELERRVAGHAVAAHAVVRRRGQAAGRRPSPADDARTRTATDAAEEQRPDHEDQDCAEQERPVALEDPHAGLPREKVLHLAVLALFSNLLSQVGALPEHPRMSRRYELPMCSCWLENVARSRTRSSRAILANVHCFNKLVGSPAKSLRTGWPRGCQAAPARNGGERRGLSEPDAQLLELLGRDRPGRARHRVAARRRLGERDDVADGVGAGEQHDDAVEAEADAAVRRRPVLERLEEPAEGLVDARRRSCPARAGWSAGRRRRGCAGSRSRARRRSAPGRTARRARRAGRSRGAAWSPRSAG